MTKTWIGGRIVAFGAAAAGITAMIVLGNQLGYELPVFARAQQLEELRIELIAGQKENAAEIIAIQQRSNQAAIYRNQAELDRAERRGASDANYQPPGYLINERILLENEGQRLRRAMQRLTK